MERKGNLPGELVSTTEENKIEKKDTSPPVLLLEIEWDSVTRF
jgi:hypothetical protein